LFEIDLADGALIYDD